MEVLPALFCTLEALEVNSINTSVRGASFIAGEAVSPSPLIKGRGALFLLGRQNLGALKSF